MGPAVGERHVPELADAGEPAEVLGPEVGEHDVQDVLQVPITEVSDHVQVLPAPQGKKLVADRDEPGVAGRLAPPPGRPQPPRRQALDQRGHSGGGGGCGGLALFEPRRPPLRWRRPAAAAGRAVKAALVRLLPGRVVLAKVDRVPHDLAVDARVQGLAGILAVLADVLKFFGSLLKKRLKHIKVN